MRLHRVFVYGTLKKGEPNHYLLTKPENGFSNFVGKAKTSQCWPLVIASQYNIPFLLFKEGSGLNVLGDVYDVDDAMLAALDELEGHPECYERVEYDVFLETAPENDSQPMTKCWIYFLKKFKHSLLELPYIDDYSSYGSHGLEYVPRYLRASIEAKELWQEIGGN